MRDTANVFDDLTPLLVFNYAWYFQVTTISNLTIGDVSAVTFEEKFLNVINIWLGTFLYNFLYSNITTIVAVMATGNHIEFFSNCTKIVSTIQNGKVTQDLINNVRGYFNYTWDRHRGVAFEKVRKQLPDSLSSDLSLSLFKNAIEKSLVFCEENCEINTPLAMSVFK